MNLYLITSIPVPIIEDRLDVGVGDGFALYYEGCYCEWVVASNRNRAKSLFLRDTSYDVEYTHLRSELVEKDVLIPEGVYEKCPLTIEDEWPEVPQEIIDDPDRYGPPYLGDEAVQS